MSPNLVTLVEILKQKKMRIGLAESCTGGLLSSLFATIPGVSEVFMGSIVSYSNEVKINLLNVSEKTLSKHGAVSVEVAREMSEGALLALGANCAISITGIAGPSGGSKDKPVGTVCFSFRGPGFEFSEKKLFAGSRTDIQKQSAEHAINSLLNALN